MDEETRKKQRRQSLGLINANNKGSISSSKASTGVGVDGAEDNEGGFLKVEAAGGCCGGGNKVTFFSKGGSLHSHGSRDLALCTSSYWAYVNKEAAAGGEFSEAALRQARISSMTPGQIKALREQGQGADAGAGKDGKEGKAVPGAAAVEMSRLKGQGSTINTTNPLHTQGQDNPIHSSAASQQRDKERERESEGRGSETAREGRDRGRRSDVNAVHAPSDLGELYPTKEDV